jgi:hypothetical protein
MASMLETLLWREQHGSVGRKSMHDDSTRFFDAGQAFFAPILIGISPISYVWKPYQAVGFVVN